MNSEVQYTQYLTEVLCPLGQDVVNEEAVRVTDSGRSLGKPEPAQFRPFSRFSSKTHSLS